MQEHLGFNINLHRYVAESKEGGSVEFYKILAQIGGSLFVTPGKRPGKALLKVTQEEVGSLITIVALK